MYRFIVIDGVFASCCHNHTNPRQRLKKSLQDCKVSNDGSSKGWDTLALIHKFEAFDDNNDERFHLEELKKAIHSIGVDISDNTIAQLFADNLQDGQDCLTFEQTAEALDKLIQASHAEELIEEAYSAVKFGFALFVLSIFVGGILSQMVFPRFQK